ncbi:MAG: LysR family transcriptional regulator [Pseudomonadota bacterium]
MIESLRAMAIFARVAESGSFRGAAKQLGVSASVVSHQISALESQLGVPLFYRSTRKVSLTEHGKLLLSPATEMIDAAQAGLAHFVENADAPVGKLNVSLPAVLTSHPVVDHLASFAVTHPAIALSLRFTDVRESLIQSGLDLAIRMGQMPDSALSQRQLTIEERYLVAGRDYVRERDCLSHPKDLDDWDFIHFSPRLSPLVLRGKKGAAATLAGRIKISVDNSQAMHRLARANVGFAALPLAMVRSDLDSGELVHLLPDWSLKALPITAVWPSNSTRNGLATRLINFLVSKLRDDSQNSEH